jgi:hypothetical protein
MLSAPPIIYLDPAYAKLHGTKHILVQARFAQGTRKYNKCEVVLVAVQQEQGEEP